MLSTDAWLRMHPFIFMASAEGFHLLFHESGLAQLFHPLSAKKISWCSRCVSLCDFGQNLPPGPNTLAYRVNFVKLIFRNFGWNDNVRSFFALWGRVEWAGAKLNGIDTWVCDIWHPWTKNIAYVGSFKHFSVQHAFTKGLKLSWPNYSAVVLLHDIIWYFMDLSCISQTVSGMIFFPWWKMVLMPGGHALEQNGPQRPPWNSKKVFLSFKEVILTKFYSPDSGGWPLWQEWWYENAWKWPKLPFSGVSPMVAKGRQGSRGTLGMGEMS